LSELPFCIAAVAIGLAARRLLARRARDALNDCGVLLPLE
jgi:hypothetical protein